MSDASTNGMPAASGDLPDGLLEKPADLLDKTADWFFLPPAYTGLIARLTAMAALPCALVLWVLGQGGQGPYIVPAWRFGTAFLELPALPPLVQITVFSAYFLAGLWLLFGKFHRFPVIILASVIAYYGSRDLMASHMSFVVLTFTYLISLLFADLKKPSCARRLIQINLTLCYFYSDFWKVLFPPFMAGESFQAEFADGWALKEMWVPFVTSVNPPLVFWQAFSWLTILVEGFIVAGLWIPGLRMAAAITGVILHGGIAVVMDKDHILTIFSLIILTGYLAFFDRKQPPERKVAEKTAGKAQVNADTTDEANVDETNVGEASASAAPVDEDAASAQAPRKIKRRDTIFAVIVSAIMIAIPARVLFWQGRPIDSLSFFDRSPWTYSMFVMRLQTLEVRARYQDSDGNWHTVFSFDKEEKNNLNLDVWKRSKDASSDNELIAIAKHVFRTEPNADTVEVISIYQFNKRQIEKKRLVMVRDGRETELTVERIN